MAFTRLVLCRTISSPRRKTITKGQLVQEVKETFELCKDDKDLKKKKKKK
ncbi:hypothetical protein Ddye_029177 [Dipteronia dyeriana]|uniref:Uncharacterized protein n=1 Tax=Dipteronia dyeriana TaxID=168575 RepID=A0AAD9TDW0_9ROSI|nr:hypothetical protein Ddye_029177 [Dipteronia dyeriana]